MSLTWHSDFPVTATEQSFADELEMMPVYANMPASCQRPLTLSAKRVGRAPKKTIVFGRTLFAELNGHIAPNGSSRKSRIFRNAP